MKEDAQLICPVSYEDPDGHWPQIEPAILDRLPLKEVTWKSPISSTFITINKLPLRFLPTDAKLFKDTDHPFRWFLSQYVSLYVVVAETLETYKIVKPNIKTWVDSNNNSRGSFGKRHWVVIYLTLGNYPAAHYSKIFAKISSDFYFERSGDRTVILSLQSDPNSLQVGSSLKTSNFQMFSSANDGLGELMAKIREGIVSSFQVRSSLYYAEIRKLDATRATPNFDFKQLFLVKESFALQYQMMQLLDMALAQYEELEAMLAYAPAGILFDGWWPLKAPEQLNPTEPPATPETPKDIMADPVKNGDDIVTYSINLARMKVLKSKMNLLELYRYIFARQMFFLVTLHRPVQCAEKVRRFLSFAYQSTESKTAEIVDPHERATALMQAKVWALTSAVKCIRLCRDLIDNMIAAENVSGLESTQSVAAILNVVRNSTYRESDYRESTLMATGDRSNRDTHMAKDKMLAFRESFVLLGDILQWAIKKFNELVPIKVLLRQHLVHSLHQTPLFAGESLPVLADDAPPAVYFQLFDRSSDVRSILGQDLDVSSFSVAGGLEQVLSSISQRIRSVSHFWAKIYHMRSFDALASQEDDAIRSDLLRKHMFLVQACRFQQPQIEKGHILEASLQALFTLAASEFNILCDRRSSALVERFHLAQHLLSTGQFLKTSQVLHGLMTTDVPGATLFVNPWSSSWPDLMQTMLLMMARCAWELKNPNDFRKAVATLITLYIQQRDFFRANVHCDIQKVVTALIHPPEGLVYEEPLVIPAKGLFSFELERNIYAEETTPNDSVSSPKLQQQQQQQRMSRSLSGAVPWTGPLPACIASAAATKVIVPSSQVVRRKGMQLVHENPFPVQWLACICDQGPIPVHLKIQSHLQAPIVVDRVSVFFRRVPPQGFDNMFGSADVGGGGTSHHDDSVPLPPPQLLSSSPLPLSPNSDAAVPFPHPPTLKSEYSSSYSMQSLPPQPQQPEPSPYEQELVCSLQPTTSLLSTTEEQVFVLDLLPRHLGDYVIDRYEICSGSLTFVHRVLDEYETTSGAAAAAAMLDFQQGPIVSDQDVQRYFDKCPIFRISPPRRILTFDVHTGSRLPPNQRDCIYVSFDVPRGDVIHELSVEMKAISRCRRWNGILPKSASFEALSSMQYRAEWISSPARSFYRAGEERSGSIDETNLNQYMTRDFSVTVDNPREWTCWAVEEGQSMVGVASMSKQDIAVLHESLLLREITGGRRVVIQVPITVRTSLLTNIAEEFTLQSPLQVHVQGVVRKGDCFVPFHAVGNATLLCSNLLQSCRLQRVAMPRQRSLMQLQLHNIHQYPLRLLGNAFVSDQGEMLNVRGEVQRHEVLCPADFSLVASAEDVTKLTVEEGYDVVRGVVLEPNEDYHAFVQVGPLAVPPLPSDHDSVTTTTTSIAAWRVFYRREEEGNGKGDGKGDGKGNDHEGESSSCELPGVRQHVFWLDVPLEEATTTSTSQGGSTSMALGLPMSFPAKEARILPVVATQAPWTCTVGGVVLLRARVGLRGASFRYLVDSAENASFTDGATTVDLSAFRSSFVFQMPTRPDEGGSVKTTDEGKAHPWCELQECPAWMPLGLKVTKASVTSTEYDIVMAVVPVQVGVHSLPPLMIQRAAEVPLLLIPHNASQLSHALIQPMRNSLSMEATTTTTAASSDILTATTVLASFEEIPTI